VNSYRSDDAYARAAVGEGNADGYKVIETGANGIIAAGKAGKKGKA
jgi:ATP-dependent DNA helicase